MCVLECSPFSINIEEMNNSTLEQQNADQQENEQQNQQYCEQLPMLDLVASVPPEVRSQPDIASCLPKATPNIMDESIDDLSRELSPVLSHTKAESPVVLTQPIDAPVAKPRPVAQTPPVVVTQPKPIMFEKTDKVISNQPTLHDEIMDLQKNVESVCSPLKQQEKQPKTLLEQASAAAHYRKEEERTETDDIIIQSQRDKELAIKEFNERQQQEQITEPLTSEKMQSQQNDVTVEVEGKSTSFGDVITDAMASVVDAAACAAAAVGETVINVVNPNTPYPVFEYHNGDNNVNVILPTAQHQKTVDPLKNGLEQLLEMGFFDRDLNKKLLKKHKFDLSRCVSELVHLNDNQWHQTRH